ncbi:hypothetical protein HYPSUDRAFT_208863 [Hypholoma sublateritium FD-334 SS-4]|uniref:Uncharacterized protein n=1 Tax=Hypholoma sublateritium (strain FD-334 SS-4) TaxID=945553 RepID=A0A0D2LTW5_HYPSF|nr:hypothetical protein HYPSUDRAFT_208863 [Hypholoma sublateritium FD-334 SS-4]
MLGENPLLAPPAYHTAINYTGTQSIHEASGRAIVLGSDIYYSPNCSRAPPLPTKPLPGQTVHYGRDPFQNKVEEFHNPQWWSAKAGYLPFLPTLPNFYCPPFHVLFSDPIGIGPRRNRRLRMDSNHALNWNRLETTLAHIFQSFQSSYSIPPMPPIVSTSLVCQGPFEYPSQFTAAEKRGRGWFSIWMAMVSLGIAVAEISDRDSGSDTPLWYRTLSRYINDHRYVDEHTMSEVRQQLGQFGPAYPRAGVFIDLKSSLVQPTVEFFVRCGIPVWYPWGTAEESLARKNPNHWRRYVPPAHLLQRARSYTIPATVAASSSDPVKPWEHFFAERQRRASGPMPAKKPTLKVFHWERDAIGSWNRVQVVRRMQQETLGTRPVTPGPEMLEPPLPILHVGPVNDTAAAAIHSSAPRVPAVSPRATDYMPEEHSPADILRLFFGFVAPPPSVRLHLGPPSEQQIKDLASGIGFPAALGSFQTFVLTEVGKCAAHFFWSICQTPWVPPPNVLFDLAPGNPQNPQKNPRLKYLCELPGGIYLFDFRGVSTVDWRIAVRDTPSVLFILRLDGSLCDYEIARELLNRGMPFATLLPVPRFAINPAPVVLRRLRLSDYAFGLADYSSYCLEQDELLCNPRVARQALKRGGIIWRLAMDRATFHNVLAGPTSVTVLQHQCLSFGTASSAADTFWVDDVLDPSEADALAGVYYVYTGRGTQTATKSWWPPIDLWDSIRPTQGAFEWDRNPSDKQPMEDSHQSVCSG